MLGDATNFAHWDEVNLSWAFIDPISQAWERAKTDIPIYESGSMGPKEADDLLAKEQLHWWPLTEDE